MQKILRLAVAVACCMAAIAPCTSWGASDVAGSGSQATLVIKDSAITSSIKAQLAADPFKGLSHIDVDTDDHGVVTLKGKVPSQVAADRATSIARATEGVRTVKSELKIKIDD